MSLQGVVHEIRQNGIRHGNRHGISEYIVGTRCEADISPSSGTWYFTGRYCRIRYILRKHVNNGGLADFAIDTGYDIIMTLNGYNTSVTAKRV